jgi:hypothetical protein
MIFRRKHVRGRDGLRQLTDDEITLLCSAVNRARDKKLAEERKAQLAAAKVIVNISLETIMARRRHLDQLERQLRAQNVSA